MKRHRTQEKNYGTAHGMESKCHDIPSKNHLDTIDRPLLTPANRLRCQEQHHRQTNRTSRQKHPTPKPAQRRLTSHLQNRTSGENLNTDRHLQAAHHNRAPHATRNPKRFSKRNTIHKGTALRRVKTPKARSAQSRMKSQQTNSPKRLGPQRRPFKQDRRHRHPQRPHASLPLTPNTIDTPTLFLSTSMDFEIQSQNPRKQLRFRKHPLKQQTRHRSHRPPSRLLHTPPKLKL